MMNNQNKDISLIINSFKSLPAMPNVVMKALTIMKDENAGMKDLAQIISCEQALTTQVLKLVNSAYYGLPQQIASLTHAMTLLGMKDIKNIIITVAMRPMMTTRGGKDLWEHSIKVALAAELLAKYTNVVDQNDAFVLGFLHDIGKIIINYTNPIVYNKVKALCQKGTDIIEAEELLVGITHTDVGFLLAKKWQLPIVIANCIKYHHDPLQSSVANAAALVCFSDLLINSKLLNSKIRSELENLTNLNSEKASELLSQIEEKSSILVNQFR